MTDINGLCSLQPLGFFLTLDFKGSDFPSRTSLGGSALYRVLPSGAAEVTLTSPPSPLPQAHKDSARAAVPTWRGPSPCTTLQPSCQAGQGLMG